MRMLTNILAGGLSVLMAVTSMSEARAMTMPSLSVPQSVQQQQSDVQQVRYRGGHGHYWHRHGGWGGHRGYYGYRRGGYYHGGYYHHHHHGGAWIPFAALAAGAIIAGAASQPSYRSHAQWCASRYRSYRAYDNTYQPYSGPRRQCR